jgi:hypothetical protein
MSNKPKSVLTNLLSSLKLTRLLSDVSLIGGVDRLYALSHKESQTSLQLSKVDFNETVSVIASPFTGNPEQTVRSLNIDRLCSGHL